MLAATIVIYALLSLLSSPARAQFDSCPSLSPLFWFSGDSNGWSPKPAVPFSLPNPALIGIVSRHDDFSSAAPRVYLNDTHETLCALHGEVCEALGPSGVRECVCCASMRADSELSVDGSIAPSRPRTLAKTFTLNEKPFATQTEIKGQRPLAAYLSSAEYPPAADRLGFGVEAGIIASFAAVTTFWFMI